jgi:hypothetical protein
MLVSCSGGESSPAPSVYGYTATVAGRSYAGTFTLVDGELRWDVPNLAPGPEVIAEVNARDWEVLAFPEDRSMFYVHHLNLPMERCTISWTRAPNDFVPGACTITAQ